MQYELEQFLQLRSSLGGQPGSPGSSAGAGSPDRSPPPIFACYSPASSPRSTTYSPLLYSPSWDRPDSPPSPPSYSPVYSDEDTEERRRFRRCADAALRRVEEDEKRGRGKK